MAGCLYVVATPIGNLEDITLRALRILGEVDLIAAEDTRHSRKLLQHHAITTRLTSFHEHNEQTKTVALVAKLQAGLNLALISDAGTPAIADPGYRLAQACRDAGIAVVAVPGPSALVAALSIAGLPTDRFSFEGFLPAKRTARRAVLAQLQEQSGTTVFYEAPHRLVAALTDLVEVLGDKRQVAVVRELTKLHEEVVRGTATEVLAHFANQERVRGELVLLVGPRGKQSAPESLAALLQSRLEDSDLPPRQIVKQLARELGLSGSAVYQEYLQLQAKRQD